MHVLAGRVLIDNRMFNKEIETLSTEETYKAKRFLKIWEVLSWFSVAIVVAMLVLRPTFPYGPKEIWMGMVAVRTLWMVGYYHFFPEKYRLQIRFVILETFIFILFAFAVIHIAGGVVTDRFYILIIVLFFLAIGYSARLIWPAAIFILVLSVGSFAVDPSQWEEAIDRPTTTVFKLIMPFMVAYIGRYLAKEAYEQRIAKEQLQRLEHDRQNFINSSAHVLRTPITAITGTIELLEQENLTEKSADYVRWIRESAQSLNNVVEELLIISRIEDGNATILKSSINIVELLTTILNTYKKKIDSKNITVTTDFNENTMCIFSNKVLLERVFTNIIDNAVKFTPQYKLIHVTVEQTKGSISVVIKDTGIGMGLNFTDELYEKFRRELDALDQQYTGAGLGLYTSKVIMDALNGTMNVESKKDVGTTVTFVFPSNDVKP